jgi:phosphomannomutase
MEVAELLDEAARWRAAEPDPTHLEQLDLAVGRADPAELAELFGRQLTFGTAGLRAPMGPGPNRMNAVVVARAATGFGEFLLDTCATTPLVVIGHDARHRSPGFARVAAERLRVLGVRVELFDGPVPTPLVAFAVRARGADAALMITASHNPAADNGMKVYAADGAQIIAPTDREIAARIHALPIERVTLGAAAPAATSSTGRRRVAGSAAAVVLAGAAGDGAPTDGYLAAAARVTAGRRWTPMTVAATALHGVGATLADRAIGPLAGIELSWEPTQRDPDPDFPTVVDPNPERADTLEALLHHATRIGADVALALDPDADRLAVALPDPEGAWRPLTGDELGALLADDLLTHSEGFGADRLIATTVVSSRLVPAMCAAAGVHHVETLTGFKWLCRPGLAHPEWQQLLLYEEALGYAVGPDARDKDGITAALAALVAIGAPRLEGRSAWDVLDDLARAHGAHVTCNGSIRRARGVEDGLGPVLGATALGGLAVRGLDRPATDVVRLLLEDATRVVVRPSGTEPKVKYYVETIEAVEVEVDPARRVAAARQQPVVDELVALLAG